MRAHNCGGRDCPPEYRDDTEAGVRSAVAMLLDFEQRKWVVQKRPERETREDPVWLLDAGGIDAIEEWDFDRSIREYIEEYHGS